MNDSGFLTICKTPFRIHDTIILAINFNSKVCRPVIEMTIPSSVDRTIVDSADGHVVLLFTQYTPFSPKDGEWTEEKKTEYAKHVFSEIDAYAPNFSSSVIGYDILTPPDIQNTFGITGGVGPIFKAQFSKFASEHLPRIYEP